MPEDFIYTVNQVAIILNKSDKTVRTYISEGALDSTKKIEERSGIEKVFISALSLANLVEKRALRVNFDALEEYTSNPDTLKDLFGRGHPSGTAKAIPPASQDTANLPTPSNVPEESLAVGILKEQVSKLEAEKEALRQDLREKDRQLEAKNLDLIAVTRENSDKYQLIALAKEQAEARLTKLSESIRILHLSTNRDIQRLQAGKLQPNDLSLLPASSEEQAADEGMDIAPEVRPPAPPRQEATRASAAPAEAERNGSDQEIQDAEPSPSRLPEKAQPSKAKKVRPKGQRKPDKEMPAPKRGFFRRLFGG